MKNKLCCLLAALTLLCTGTARALELHWSTGADTIGTASAKRAVCVLQAAPGEESLLREARLLWATDNVQLAITPLDSLAACSGDTAQVISWSAPLTSAEIVSHLSTARFCPGVANPPARAAWAIDLPAGGRGQLRVCAFDGTDPTGVISSGTISFGATANLSLTPNLTVVVPAVPVYYASPVTLKAVVVPVTSGKLVSFWDTGTLLGTATTGGNSIASLVVSNLAVGTRTITATFDSVGSLPATMIVQAQMPTTTVLSAVPSPSRDHQAVQITATVTPSASTGSVSLTDQGVSVGTMVLANGIGAITLSNLAVGAHSFVGTYVGDVTHSGSVSAGLDHFVNPLITTQVSLGASTAIAGESVQLDASITPATASGTIRFKQGGTLVATRLLAQGQASFTTPNLCGGTQSYSVEYQGDSLHYGCSVQQDFEVGPRDVQVIVSSSLPSSRYTQAVHFVASIVDSAQIACDISGSAQFYIDEIAFGVPVNVSGNTATSASISTLAPGRHSIRATFSGNTSFGPATSATMDQDVELPNPRLVSVRDIAGDQGGSVKLSWSGSYLDLPPFNRIDSYWVLRSAPAASALSRAREIRALSRALEDAAPPEPGTLLAVSDQDTTYYWEYVGAQTAFHVSKYSFVAPTTTDSIAGSNPFTAFMIMARTPAGAEWWFSNPDSGYSVDNLAPRQLRLDVSTSSGNSTTAAWEPCADADFSEYRLYWGVSSGFIPSESNLVYRGTETVFMEPARSMVSYYKLSAVDVHGNRGAYTTAVAHGALDAEQGAPLVFGIHRVWPSPSRAGRVFIECTLTRPAAAILEVLDVAGRRVSNVSLQGRAAGRQQFDLGASAGLKPGLYLVRLSQGAEVKVGRFVVLE